VGQKDYSQKDFYTKVKKQLHLETISIVTTAILILILLLIIIIIKRQFIRLSNMARVTTRAPHNVHCSYSGRQLVTEVGSRKQMCLEHHFER